MVVRRRVGRSRRCYGDRLCPHQNVQGRLFSKVRCYLTVLRCLNRMRDQLRLTASGIAMLGTALWISGVFCGQSGRRDRQRLAALWYLAWWQGRFAQFAAGILGRVVK